MASLGVYFLTQSFGTGWFLGSLLAYGVLMWVSLFVTQSKSNRSR